VTWRGISRLVLLAGVVSIGLFFFRSVPRDVTLVYVLGAEGVREVGVDIERGGETVRHAELRFAQGAPAQVRHAVRLPDGEYVLHLRLQGSAGTRRVDRPLAVSESGTIVLPVGP